MIDQKVLASINLHAVLRNIEDLVRLCPEASQFLPDKSLAIRFSVPGLDKLVLNFSDTTCQALRGDDVPYNMNLRFSNPEHLNLMVEGKKNPLPTKGFTHIGFLKNQFTALAELLTDYLKPDPERLKTDLEFNHKSTELTAYTAFYALSEIGNIDVIGKLNAGRIEDGVINVEVKDGPSLHIIKEKDHLTTVKGKHVNARAFMYFDSVETAGGILTGALDSYAAIGSGKLAFRGRIPMIDNLNKLLTQVSAYLA